MWVVALGGRGNFKFKKCVCVWQLAAGTVSSYQLCFHYPLRFNPHHSFFVLGHYKFLVIKICV